ncbi:tetratricopeptide repeat protein [Flavobacterium sp. ANB]|uniref:tetratricopeptide repeat protein n=1 Tax=unclassified Flavobacterium TaxID=196869 RepID=UPI0012B72CA0|nr:MULTISPECIES: tetratricopeptide repeat protein [unclassified Flavobacterium]MBF4516194.1 tetratricopeptide repeat protein [Flavobacterium sp. ANB]MTD69909.1 tetratricopeptide repeat protein [Flavobacterium sp. LC2016-13]
MKKLISILILLLFNCHFLNAQKITKKETIVKSTSPLEINPSIDYDITSALDSTNVSRETFEILKKIAPLIEEEKNREVLDLLNSIDEKDFNKNELLLFKGILELKLEDLVNASNSFSKYIPQTSSDSIKSSVYHILGIIDMKRDLQISSYHNFERAYELDNKNISALLILGTLNFKKNDFEKALFYYEKIVKINPNFNNVWNNIGFLYLQKENYVEAKKIFSKIIKDEPDAPLPYNNRSYSNLKLGFTKQAMADVNKSLKLFPENSYAYRNRALIYLNLKEAEKACTDIEMAFKLGYKEKYGTDLDLIQSQNCKK